MAAIGYCHEIDDESVTIYRDPAMDGNALKRLGDRLAAAPSQPAAVSAPSGGREQ